MFSTTSFVVPDFANLVHFLADRAVRALSLEAASSFFHDEFRGATIFTWVVIEWWAEIRAAYAFLVEAACIFSIRDYFNLLSGIGASSWHLSFNFALVSITAG